MGKICTRFQTKKAQKPQELITDMFNLLQRHLVFFTDFLSNFILTPVLYIPSFRMWGRYSTTPPFHHSMIHSSIAHDVLAEVVPSATQHW